MKFVMVKFPDTVDTSTLKVDASVTVGAVLGGTVVMAGVLQDGTSAPPILHIHPIGSTTTGPATTTP